MQIGIYKNETLIKSYKSEDKSSEALPSFMKSLLERYTPDSLYFVKGPGSFMAIKISYIYLKSLSVALNIPLYACDAFSISKAVKAHGKLYFFKENGEIVTKICEKPIKNDIMLPFNLKDIDFSSDCEPLYILPAI